MYVLPFRSENPHVRAQFKLHYSTVSNFEKDAITNFLNGYKFMHVYSMWQRNWNKNIEIKIIK